MTWELSVDICFDLYPTISLLAPSVRMEKASQMWWAEELEGSRAHHWEVLMNTC